MCLVAHHLAVNFLPLSTELFVIRGPKTQTASFRIIIVQRNLCFKGPLVVYMVLLFQLKQSFWPQFPLNPGNSNLLSHLFVFGCTNQIKSPVYALQSCLLFPYALP
jgi:hypothetical protein